MSVSGLSIDLYPLLQFIFTAFLIAIGILHLVKTTASKYFVVDEDNTSNFEQQQQTTTSSTTTTTRRRRERRRREEVASMVAVANTGDGCSCALCGNFGIKQCSACKAVKYCSASCQSAHWKAGHKQKCKELKFFRAIDATPSLPGCVEKVSVCDKGLPRLKKVLFPYEDFVKLYNWENIEFFPCGLLNCGNSCYANVVLQCLSCTRPLIAYLLEVGHKEKCRRNDWCFLCELETHVVRARFKRQPFSPMNILSRLPNIGANLGYGKQEDAHEFMRFAIDTMQSVCLDEFGGEKALHPSSQETTLIQYIFGGHLQSQVKCSECNKISYRHENMMDLTVEIQGDAESLEECLEQFTAEELLDGENMYKCEGCNDYVKASKRLAIHHAPNILTIALKRFQSGRFGKLNKRVAFPETLDLGPYMTEPRYGTDLYQLYAVVVHVDMLNASYFGHYICYTKDSHGNWHRIDDCRVTAVDLEEVLAQGAYMLLYSRTCVRPSFVKPVESCKEEKLEEVAVVETAQPCSLAAVDSEGSIESLSSVASVSTDVRSPTEEEMEQRVDVVMEAQPCFQLPVEGSLKTMATDVGSSTTEPSSDKNDSLEDCDNEQPHSSDIGSSVEVINGGVLASAPLTEAFQSGETHGSNCEVSVTTDKQNFEAGNGVYNNESVLSEVSVDNSLPSQSDIHELAEMSCSHPSSGLNSVPSNLQERSSSRFCIPQNLKLEQDSTFESFNGIPAVKIAKGNTSHLIGYKSCSNSKQRPAFYPGFLDKRTRKSEKFSNGAEPGYECSNVSSHVAEIAPAVKLADGVHISAPLTNAPLLTEAYDSGNELKEPNNYVDQIIENGNSSLSSQKVGSFPHDHTDHEMNETTNVPVVALDSDREMLDVANLVNSFQTQQSPSLVHIASDESCEGVTGAQHMESLSSNMNKVNSFSRRSKPVFSPGFLDKQSKVKFHNKNDAPEGLGQHGSSCKVNNCNGFTNPGSHLQNGSEANSYDTNFGGTSLLKSTKVLENNDEKIHVDKDERIGRAQGEAVDSCNNIGENKTCNLNQTQGTYWGNGEDLFSPGFLNRPSQKNSLKKKCEKTFMEEDERIANLPREACDPPQSHCNGNENGFCFDENRICDQNQRREMFCGNANGNDNDIVSPGGRRKNKSLIKDDEGTSLSGTGSSNHERSKVPRVG
ncbi:hypothetical protein AQUCO_00400035v1 [Aquilegia coerulea]|uniref:USP domain-containing protein n=1 Tax=Aquilegia coerulea TaxID=218851 RepID=A0A2G5ET86_AQUCA|nr:hypothetical protein AQUCO_00400035v1 [Aquilegia coerulea]